MLDAGETTLNGNNGADTHARVQAAAEIFSKYGNQIRAIIVFHVKDEARADDLFQDFFVSIVQNPIPAHIEDVETYIYRALTHDTIDGRRRANNYLDGIQKYAAARKYDVTQDDPQSNIMHVEATQQMLRLLEAQLSKREAAVLWHRYCNGLDTADTAKETNMDKRSVTRYLSLARKKIRKLIPQDLGRKQ